MAREPLNYMGMSESSCTTVDPPQGRLSAKIMATINVDPASTGGVRTILAELNTPIQLHPMGEEAKLQTFKWFSRFIQDFKVDDAIVHSAEMKQLHAHLIDICWLVNNILLWNVEQRSGDMWNLVSIIMIQDNKTVQEAMNDAEQELRLEANQWWSAKMCVLEAYKAHQDIQDLTLLIERIQFWPLMVVEWSYNSASNRYFGSHQASGEAQRTGIVHILPRRQEKATHVGGNHG
ncbi:hypothetical protein DFH09DRAFT_1069422 [Mycena vulgaris]|nr:hypothetical protein DFH09DRAFT_1069422 [Mycena vulgaris]